MARSKHEIQAEVIKIKDNNFDVKDHFPLILANRLANKTEDNDKIFVPDELIYEERLEQQLQKNYTGKDYVLIFYAHRPHSPAMVSPYYPNEPAAHTSLLLCKVNEDGKINNVLNIDGYHFPGYVDILGEREGAPPNPHIKQRLVLQPSGSEREPLNKTPLQRASWQNMNCMLYAVTFAERIIQMISEEPRVMEHLFPKEKNEKVSQESLFLLEERIMEGMADKYVRKVGPNYIYDQSLAKLYHDGLRNDLAVCYEAQFVNDKERIVAPTESTSVVTVSLFKPHIMAQSESISEPLELCISYKKSLNEELKRVAPGKDPLFTLKTHQINTQNPSETDQIIKKLIIVNAMLTALNDSNEPNHFNRIKNMKAILTPENKATLAEHRSTGGKFLNSILCVLSKVFNLELKYRAKGEELSDNLENLPLKNN